MMENSAPFDLGEALLRDERQGVHLADALAKLDREYRECEAAASEYDRMTERQLAERSRGHKEIDPAAPGGPGLMKPEDLADTLKRRIQKALARFELKRNGRRRPTRKARQTEIGGKAITEKSPCPPAKGCPGCLPGALRRRAGKIKRAEERKMAAKIIYGIENIENFMGAGWSVESKSAVSGLLRVMKQSFEFPMKPRRNSQGTKVQSLDLKEFRSWARENGINPGEPEKITLQDLERAHFRRHIEAMPDRVLRGWREICAFTRLDIPHFLEWRDFVDYPVRKTKGAGGEVEANSKDLLQFLLDRGAPLPMVEIFRRRPAA